MRMPGERTGDACRTPGSPDSLRPRLPWRPGSRVTRETVMDRFDRDDANPDSTPATAGGASDKLRSTVEAQVREVVEEAKAHAAAIGDRALPKGDRIERESRSDAAEALEGLMRRAEGMIAAIETLEGEL